jgi:nucleoside-diphosphate-sugar epimerase
MKTLLITGSSSGVGKNLLSRLLLGSDFLEIWCGSRKPLSNASEKLHPMFMDLRNPIDLTSITKPIDMTIHCAAETHSIKPESYSIVNFLGTQNLVNAVREKGCKNFIYISSGCVGNETGPYCDSKKAAENFLLSMEWESLLIIRPSDVYGGSGKEGIEGFIGIAKKFHFVPMLFGSSNILFRPIHVDDLIDAIVSLVLTPFKGMRIVEIFGPEVLTGVDIAFRIAQKYRAVPIPVSLNLVRLIGVLGKSIGMPFFPLDQITRLSGEKCSGKYAIDSSRMGRFLKDVTSKN